MEAKTKEQIAKEQTAKDNAAKKQAAKDNAAKEANDSILERLDQLESENSAQKKELHSLKNKKVGSLKKGATLERPSYKDKELSKRMPLDKFFNKVSHHNQGDKNSPIGVNTKVDYFHVTFGKEKFTFWKGLALTLDQVSKLPKVYTNHLCAK